MPTKAPTHLWSSTVLVLRPASLKNLITRALSKTCDAQPTALGKNVASSGLIQVVQACPILLQQNPASVGVNGHCAPAYLPPERSHKHSVDIVLAWPYSGHPPDYISGHCAADIVQNVVPNTSLGSSFSAATIHMAVSTGHSIAFAPCDQRDVGSTSKVILLLHSAPNVTPTVAWMMHRLMDASLLLYHPLTVLLKIHLPCLCQAFLASIPAATRLTLWTVILVLPFCQTPRKMLLCFCMMTSQVPMTAPLNH